MSIHFQAHLGRYQSAVNVALVQIQANKILSRIWQKDYSVWQHEPTEITNRLGWLESHINMAHHLTEIDEFVAEVKADGYTDAVLLGMGGSSLAPELFSLVFGPTHHGLKLSIVDTTDPDAILALSQKLNPKTSLFIVATKSGGTVETLSAFTYFYNWTLAAVGKNGVGAHFIGITDPGSKIVTLGEKYLFRKVFLNDPNIGGRYSALSYFGLVPAALVGVDIKLLLHHAEDAIKHDELAGELGAMMGELAKVGRDKLTLVCSSAIASFGDWVEQLVAESTGKEEKGILPVVGEPLGDPAVYGNDRFFVQIALPGDNSATAALDALQKAGHPVVRFTLHGIYDLSCQFLLWELATAVAGHVLHIHPFDQPNVESAKIAARHMVAEYHKTGHIPAGEVAPLSPESLQNFLSSAKPGSYIALQAYVPPTPETTAALAALQQKLRDTTHLAVTVGYGPRFLHSTGQLHKGDGGRGYFVQFTNEPHQDVAIPDEAGKPDSSMSFGVLKLAQALGDGQALKDGLRPLIRFHITGDVASAIRSLC